MSFLTGRFAIVVTILLAVQSFGSFAIDRRKENVPNTFALKDFPNRIGAWETRRDYPMEEEVQKVLKATDYMVRDYVKDNSLANLYIAYFRSQKSGVAPHSPKNCLPGNGWVEESNDRISVDVPGFAPIEANRYTVQKGEIRNVVLYWYQSRQRTIASEYKAKLFVVADAIRLNRTDTSLVRVITQVVGGNSLRANEDALQFTRDVYPTLVKQLPQ